MQMKIKKWFKKRFKMLPTICFAISIFVFNWFLSNHSVVAIVCPSKTAAILLFVICLFIILNVFSYINYSSKKSLLMFSISLAINLLLTVLLFMLFKEYQDNYHYLKLSSSGGMTESQLEYKNSLDKSNISLYIALIFQLIGFGIFIAYAIKEDFLKKNKK